MFLLVRFAHTEVCAIRMMEDERANAGLRFHHEAFGQLDADFFWAE